MYVYDGQHRLAALMLLFGDSDYYVWCEIHNFDESHNTAYAEEARYFAEQDDNKTVVGAIDKFNALVEAKDEKAIRVSSLLLSCGLRLARNKNDRSDCCVACIRKVMSIYDDKGISEEDFLAIFNLVAVTWRGAVESLDARIIDSVALFHKTYRGMYDPARFAKALRTVLPKEIIAIGNSDLSAKGTLRFAKVVWQKYNKGKREHLPYLYKG